MIQSSAVKPLIIAHGGAWDIPKIRHRAHLRGLGEALRSGQRVLGETDDALKTAIAVMRSLEDDPTFDAGTGSFLNDAGEVEMDAGIMEGRELTAGAVAAIRNVAHPVEVANRVRTSTQHVMLVGNGATSFAREQGQPLVETEALLVGREKKLYQKLKSEKQVRIKSFFEQKRGARDTVGVVVINSNGHLVAATSTGGTPFKKEGRVGDSPLIGCGFYADNRVGGASSTGWGEGIMRVMLARTALENLKSGEPAMQAAKKAIEQMHNDVAGEGGVILIDRLGNPGYAFNTPFMAMGIASTDKIEELSI